MPSKKRRSAQASQNQNYREWRSRLKAQGLFGRRVNLRSKVTPAQKRQIAKYKDVATGKAKVFRVAKKDAPKLRKLFGLKGKDDIVVVPKKKGERVTYSKKTGEITIAKKDRKRILEAEFKEGKQIPGTRLFYSIYFQRGDDEESYSFEDFEELKRFMSEYEKDSVKPKRKGWKTWRQYVVREYLDNEEISERREEGTYIKTKRLKSKRRKASRRHK